MTRASAMIYPKGADFQALRFPFGLESGVTDLTCKSLCQTIQTLNMQIRQSLGLGVEGVSSVSLPSLEILTSHVLLAFVLLNKAKSPNAGHA